MAETLSGRKERRIVPDDPGQHLKVRLTVPVRGAARGELHQGDAEGPNVRPDVVIWVGRVGRLDSFRLRIRER